MSPREEMDQENDRHLQEGQYPCSSCGAPITACELCEACAKAQQPVDLEASGGWMVQDAKP